MHLKLHRQNYIIVKIQALNAVLTPTEYKSWFSWTCEYFSLDKNNNGLDEMFEYYTKIGLPIDNNSPLFIVSGINIWKLSSFQQFMKLVNIVNRKKY